MFQLNKYGETVAYRRRGLHYPFWRVPPPTSQFSWVNQGTATLTQLSNRWHYLLAAPVAGDQWRLQTRTAPATPYSLRAAIFPQLLPTGAGEQARVGVGFRSSATGRLNMITVYWDGDLGYAYVDLSRWTSPTALSAVIGGPAIATFLLPSDGPIFFRLRDDGSSIYWDYSLGGGQYVNWGSESRTAFFAAGPDHLCWGVNADNANTYIAGTLASWYFE